MVSSNLRSSFLLAACCAGAFLCSCSAGFDREWKQSVGDYSRRKPQDITGPWKGTWTSGMNGHTGELRCIVSATAAEAPAAGMKAGEPFKFHYHATFMNFLSATYDVTHRVRRTRDGFSFTGDQAILGKGSGTYHYEGRATPGEFHATFRSESDHGVFEMKRP